MTKNFKKVSLITSLVLTTFLSSCTKDSNNNLQLPERQFGENGVDFNNIYNGSPNSSLNPQTNALSNKITNPSNSWSTSYQDILSKWDTDQNDKGLTYQEILENVDKNNDGSVSNEELTDTGLDSESVKLVSDRLGASVSSQNTLVYELVELDKKIFPGGITKISANDIQQGKRNVCYFLSGLAGLGFYNRGQDILKMIDKNRNNTFTINFPGIKGNKTYTVNYPSENDLDTLIFPGKNGSQWVPLLVNAYTKYGESGGRPFKHVYAKDYVSDYGLTWEGIEAQTGKRANSYLLDFYNEDKLANNIKTALENKKVIEICTFLKGNLASPINPKKNQYKISKAHILTVTGIDTDKGVVYIRDPYGKYEYYDENGKETEVTNTDGLMAFNLKDLKKYFLDISIESNDAGTFNGIRNIFDRFF